MKAYVGMNLASVRFGDRRIGPAVALLVPLTLLLASGCTTTKPLESRENTAPMFIDGELTEWSGSMQQVGSAPIRMGLRHDDAFVYVSLQTMDETMLSRIMMGGLTLWFNKEGNHDRETGIRYPIGIVNVRRDVVDPEHPPTAAPDRPSMMDELELVNSQGMSARWPANRAPGIEVRSYLEYGAFSYELKIPIEQSAEHELAISPGGDGIFGLGIETGAVNSRAGILANPQLQNPEADTGGRRGRRSAPSGSSVTRGTGNNSLDPLILWTRVQLVNRD